MSEQEFMKVFSNNLKRYMNQYELSNAELAKRIGVSGQSVTNWTTGQKVPRMDKVDAMCRIFNCKRSDLMEEHTETEGYYLDPETAKVAQELFDDPNMRILFDAARDARPEDLRKAADYLKAVKAMQLGLDNEGV